MIFLLILSHILKTFVRYKDRLITGSKPNCITERTKAEERREMKKQKQRLQFSSPT